MGKVRDAFDIDPERENNAKAAAKARKEEVKRGLKEAAKAFEHKYDSTKKGHTKK